MCPPVPDTQELRPRVRRVLLAVLDGVAIEGGRRPFIVEVRSILACARRWKATSLDVDAGMPRAIRPLRQTGDANAGIGRVRPGQERAKLCGDRRGVIGRRVVYDDHLRTRLLSERRGQRVREQRCLVGAEQEDRGLHSSSR